MTTQPLASPNAATGTPQSSLALVIADTSQHKLAANALAHSLRELNAAGVPIGQVLIYSDLIEPWGGLSVTTIPPMQSIADYNRLITKQLAKDLHCDHALIIQYDGFVLRGQEFSPHFRHYDYIGAPWPHLPDTPVGNGGFSWRSRRLVEAVASLPYDGEGMAEDLFICRSARTALEAQGLQWAPPALAAHFSVESVAVPHPTFGFHGIFHLPEIYRENIDWLLENLSPHTLKSWEAHLRPAFARLSPAALAAFKARLADRKSMPTTELGDGKEPVGASQAPAGFPLNHERAFDPWPAFDPGTWIDFNPSCVRLPSGQWLGVIRRDAYPPVPGKGTVWTVPLDDELRPAGPPTQLLARGEDPRIVCIGNRAFVFYCVIERDAEDRICGSAVRLAECLVEGDPGAETLRATNHLELPKNPVNRPRLGDPHAAWEKNWVPFVISSDEIGLIYSHAPWEVLVLNVDSGSTARRFVNAFRGPELSWAWGQIRGGTVPVPAPAPYGEDRLITFFHSSAVVGSRKLYFVGACVFDAKAPFTPRQMTMEPLLVAPYHSGAHRFGWRFAGSVVFPLGTQALENGFRLLCGLDDGAIAPYTILHEQLLPRLQELHLETPLRNAHGEPLNSRGEPLAPFPFDETALHAARLLALLHPGGGSLIDAAPGDGIALARLAPRFDRALAFFSSEEERRTLRRVLALNDLDTVDVREGVATLDTENLEEVALVLVDDPELSGPVLSQALETLQRCRPIVLLQMPTEEAKAALVGATLAEAGYLCEALFPFSPVRRLALPAERRSEFSWLI